MGSAWGYIVRYKKTTDPFSALTFDTVTTNSYTLSSLLQSTNYHWQVKTMCDVNGGNNSVFTSFTTFTTGSCNITLQRARINVGCFGGSDGSIDLTVLGGSGSYSYSWSNGSTSEDLTSLVAGTYNVTVTDNTWGCVDSTSVTITEPASAFSVGITSTGSASVCPGNTVSLSMSTWASGANTYQWSDANGVISGATSSTYTALVSGTYNLTVTNPAGCTAISNDLAVNFINVSVPTGLSTSNILLTKATMNWSAVADADHYDIRMREQGATSWTISLNSLYGTSKEKTNLSSSTTYEWKIRSACSSDSSSVSAWSSVQTFTTAGPCTTPTNPSELNITATSAELVWDIIPSSWGYRIMYLQNGAPWNTKVIDTTNTNIDAISGLTPGVTSVSYTHLTLPTKA